MESNNTKYSQHKTQNIKVTTNSLTKHEPMIYDVGSGSQLMIRCRREQTQPPLTDTNTKRKHYYRRTHQQ